MKILIADDQRATRILLRRSLERWSYEVVEAADGEEAWEVLLRDQPRLVISDWEMPKLEGPELCRRIRGNEQTRFVYVLLLTSHSDAGHLVEALEAGADDFVPKPFNVGELEARIGVGRRILSLQDELAQKNKALELSNAQLSHQAATDALTQAGNRRSFDLALAALHERAVREKKPYGLVLTDVDHFKSVNDRFGHGTGDEVLKATAAALRAALPPLAGLYRYGGEEFVVTVPDCDPEALQALAESLRLAVEAMRVPHERGVLQVTASSGTARYDTADDSSASMVIFRADSALYVAKRNGRNRVASFEQTSQA